MPQQSYSTAAGSDGTARISVRARGPGGWRVTQVSNSMVAGTASAVAGAASCGVYLNGFLVAPAVAQGDAVAGEPPVDLQPGGDEMTIDWTGCNPGNVCQAIVFYDPLPAG